MTRAAVAVALAVLASACAPKLMKLPSGPGQPAADGAEALAAATTACRGVRTITAEIAVAGSLHGGKVRARLAAGFAAPASARIEAVAPFGAPFFIFVASGGDSQLLLPRDERFVAHAAPAALLDAAAGVPFGPDELMQILTGCGVASPDVTDARRAGDRWRILTLAGERRLYLEHASGQAGWRVSAMTAAAPNPLRVEYRDFQSGFPRQIRIRSAADRADHPLYDLTLTLSQVETNTSLTPDAFRVQVPRGATPISIDELRRGGLLGAERRSS